MVGSLFGLLLLVVVGGVISDNIFVNESELSLRVDTFSENVLVKGYHRHYIRLRNRREKIVITCTKNVDVNGTIMAFVNTKLATQIKCLHYYNDLIGDDNFCESKLYEAYLEPDQSSFVDIWCRMLSHSHKHDSYANLFLSRLYEDNQPRIRNGLTLTTLDSTVTHFVNLETISCEATKDRSQSENEENNNDSFDSLVWFTGDSSFPLTQDNTDNKRYNLNYINDQFVNYSSLFPLESSLLRNNSIYKCCTLFDGRIRACQRFLAYIYAPPPPTPPPPTPPPQPLIPMPVFNTAYKGGTSLLLAALNKNSNNMMSNFTMEDFMLLNNETKNNQFDFASFTTTKNSEISDSEIGLIVGSVAGTVIIMLIVLLGVLCYRKYRYDQIYLKKEQINTLHTKSVHSRKLDILRAEFRRREEEDNRSGGGYNNSEPIRAFEETIRVVEESGNSSDLGNDEIKIMANSKLADRIAVFEPKVQKSSIKKSKKGGLTASSVLNKVSMNTNIVLDGVGGDEMSTLENHHRIGYNGGVDRNYERIDPNEISLITGISNVDMFGVSTNVLGGCKELDKLEKEARKLAKQRADQEAKEAKLQTKLLRLQAKRGEPVALALLQSRQQDSNTFRQNQTHDKPSNSMYGIPRILKLTDRIVNESSTFNPISFIPPPPLPLPLSQSVPQSPPPPPPPAAPIHQSLLRPISTIQTTTTNHQGSSLYAKAVSYPKQQQSLADQQTMSHPLETDNFQETVYVTPADNQIVLMKSVTTDATPIKNNNNNNKRRNNSNANQNGKRNIENSNLLY